MNEEYLSVSCNDSGIDLDSFIESDNDFKDNGGEFTGESAVSDISAGDSHNMGSDWSDGFNDGYVSIENSGEVYTVVDIDNELLFSIREEISSLNSTVFLIFMFLLLSWTEKKLSVVVNRFTRERK